jgi:CRISPR/Cas system CMR-associated protein Cmr5 small subunit
VYLEFSINPNFKNDVEKFVEGKYSQFSNRAKTIIRTNSGLMYRTVVGLTSRTDIRLLALDKSPLLKELWDEFLDLDVGEETELLSKPTDTFLEVNLLPK